MPITVTASPFVEIKIGNGEDIGMHMIDFEWKAFVNSGYVIRVKIADPYFRILKSIGTTANYLDRARNGPVKVQFKIGWKGGTKEQIMQDFRVAYISDLDQYGQYTNAQFEFVAVDPPNYLLNAGSGEGKVYKGNITKVIKDVVRDFAPGVEKVQVTETDDNKDGLWPMMRQDPKTFIKSLLDWSTNITPNKTKWMIVSKDFEIHIKEQSDLLANKIHYGSFNVSRDSTKLNDITDYHLLTHNFLSVYQSSIVTQGISTTSGKFIDKKTDPKKVEINDENTGNKINVNMDSEQGFNKPSVKSSTAINSIPEDSAGDLGIKYEDYIGGRARQLYLSMLPMVMRLRVGLNGMPKFDDPLKLGVSTLRIEWKDLNDEDYFLSGKWIVYGFYHHMTVAAWTTDVYLYRIDHNANARPI